MTVVNCIRLALQKCILNYVPGVSFTPRPSTVNSFLMNKMNTYEISDCYKRIIIDLLNDAYQEAAHKGFMTLNPSNGSS
jgi:hypothetical protein